MRWKSILLVTFDLVHIISPDHFDIWFGRYAAKMVQVNSVSVIAVLLVLCMVYKCHTMKPHPSFIITKPNPHSLITYI